MESRQHEDQERSPFKIFFLLRPKSHLEISSQTRYLGYRVRVSPLRRIGPARTPSSGQIPDPRRSPLRLPSQRIRYKRE